MQRILIFFLILAILSNAVTSSKWRSHHTHNRDCHHRHDEWDSSGEDSSSSEEHDWPQYNKHGHHHGWDGDWHHQHHQPYPHHDWGGSTGFHRRTPSTAFPSSTTPTPFPFESRGTVTPNAETTFIPPSDTTVFSSPASTDPSTISPSSLPPSDTLVTDVQACERSCLVTGEFNPVCGTNYQTYNNMGRFNCAQACGVDVRIFLKRACPTPGVGFLRTTAVECIRACPLTEEINPACGSDGFTYDNPSQLLCAQTCGHNVVLRSMSSCGSVVTETQSPSLPKTQNLPFGVRSCIESCATTPENNPVCGTNDVTYQNPTFLDCARICGVDVEIKERSPCGQTNVNIDNNPSVPNNVNPSVPNVNDQRETPLPPAIQMCLNSCPVTDNISPVCGTNGITYINPSQLECDKLCGIRVDILLQTPCPPNTNIGDNSNNQVTSTSATLTSTLSSAQIQACITACPQTPEHNPVCGSNGVTYKNAGHLGCAQSCGIRVNLQRRSSCPRTTPGNPTTTQSAIPITNPIPTIDINGASDNVNEGANDNSLTQSTNLNNGNTQPDRDATTLSPDLLMSVFSDTTTVKSTSTTEPDEETDFDTRFGEDGV